jgi:hypothetical protein
MERQGKKIEPRMQKGVKVIEPPLKRAALAIDRNIKRVVENAKKRWDGEVGDWYQGQYIQMWDG